MIGTHLKHYRIVEKIGEGGMGVVYRALDSHLDRTVAIKVLRPEAVGDPERKWRFVREAKAASALNHPHIVTIHDIDSDEGVDFLVMEYLEGTPLDRLIPKTGLSIRETLDYATQIASALGAAHAAGIVHRDVKPGNVLVGPSGRVKVLDFGLAKLVEPDAPPGAETDSTATAATAFERTRQGVILGTIAYMSPEQAVGQGVDARSDVFSLGSVVYEMLAGRRPFQGDSHLLTLTAILRDPPPPLKSVRSDVPAALERIVGRSLAKSPGDRFPTANEMEAELRALSGGESRTPESRKRAYRLPLLAAVAAVVLLAAAGGWWYVRASRARKAREVMLPEVARLVEQQKFGAAVALAREAERDAPADVARMRRESWLPVTVVTDPAGASVFMKQYADVKADWQALGPSPVETRMPLANYRWRLTKPGFATVEAAAATFRSPIALIPASRVPEGMVRTSGGMYSLRSLPPVALDDFWIDKYEVTNGQFKKFVDAGGYSRREYWKEPFVREGREIPWDEAMGQFRDVTGRPGPATWELGSFPEGRDNFPVGGVSWFEAAAYAEFVGKSLPTIFHWFKAAGIVNFSEILQVSNFSGKGPAAVGTYQGLGPEGTYDMAGNVKEWCWNENAGRRYILGGAWFDASYQFLDPDAQDPFSRLPAYGFRCARFARPLSDPTLSRAVGVVARDYSKETPVSDDVFRVYRSLYSYDKGPLDARVEGPVVVSQYWRTHRVSYLSADRTERIPAILFTPLHARPPWQTVVYFPSTLARLTRSSADMDLRNLDFVVRSGRAVLCPIFKGMYERRTDPGDAGPQQWRDFVIQWSKELGRSIDYLETRPDVAKGKIAYYGVSLGAIDGIPMIAVEDRFQAAVLLTGGFRFTRYPPEIEPINFISRVKVPVLYISGRNDFAHPYETAQMPFFRMLGTAEKDKKHFVFEGGHIPPRIQPIIKEILDWLDKYLGTVPVASADAPAG
ncbi:MAG: protein kinase [Acidobacteriota bacterium]